MSELDDSPSELGDEAPAAVELEELFARAFDCLRTDFFVACALLDFFDDT